MAAPSPLSQQHTAHSDASDSEDEQVGQVGSKLGELELVEEVEIDVESLNPLSPEVISRQATINIGEYCSAPLLCVHPLTVSPLL